MSGRGVFLEVSHASSNGRGPGLLKHFATTYVRGHGMSIKYCFCWPLNTTGDIDSTIVIVITIIARARDECLTDRFSRHLRRRLLWRSYLCQLWRCWTTRKAQREESKTRQWDTRFFSPATFTTAWWRCRQYLLATACLYLRRNRRLNRSHRWTSKDILSHRRGRNFCL